MSGRALWLVEQGVCSPNTNAFCVQWPTKLVVAPGCGALGKAKLYRKALPGGSCRSVARLNIYS